MTLTRANIIPQMYTWCYQGDLLEHSMLRRALVAIEFSIMKHQWPNDVSFQLNSTATPCKQRTIKEGIQ